MGLDTYGAMPGVSDLVESAESQVWWGRDFVTLHADQVLGSASVDAGNTPTTTLRAGLVLAVKESDGLLYPFDPDATNGLQIAHAVLDRSISMLNNQGTAVNKQAHVLLAGALRGSKLLIEGTAFIGHTAEQMVRRQLEGTNRFFFDTKMRNGAAFLGGALANKSVDATGGVTSTVAVADNGTRFISSGGDVEFTLPTLGEGLIYEFLQTTDHELVVASAEGDNMIVGNDLSADSVTFTTAGQQIGALVRVEGIRIGSTLKWLVTLPNAPFGTGLTGGFAYAIAT